MDSTKHHFNCSIPQQAGTNGGMQESAGAVHKILKRLL